MKRAMIFGVGIALLGGCTDRMPTDMNEDATVAEQASLTAAASLDVRATALDGIDDALDRIIPALSEASAAKPLEAALAGLRIALADANAEGVPALIDAAQSAVDRYARTGSDPADLDAIRLALDFAQQVLIAG